MGRDPERQMLSGRVRKYEVFPGRNRFCCDGRVMLSTQTGIFYFTLFLIIATSCCFFAIDASYIWIRVSPILPVLAGLQCIFVSVVLCRTACGDPGVIPRASPAEAKALEQQIANETNANNSEAKKNNTTYSIPPRLREVTINGVPFKLKYCYTCKIFRPPRASHCSVCDNCVDRFDHHCPWVGNCVGRRNYKYFYLFLSSLTFYCLYLLALAITAIALRTKDVGFAQAMASGPLSPVVALVAFFSIWSVAGLAGFHTHLIGANMTTNEDIKGTFKRSRGGTNPFTEGNCCKNFASILCVPLPPSLLDRRGWVTEDDIPTTNQNSASGRIAPYPTAAGTSVGEPSSANNITNLNRVNDVSTVAIGEESTSRGQVPGHRNVSDVSQISNGNASAGHPPRYLPPIDHHVTNQNREYLT